MFSIMRRRISLASLIATLALVFAMSGGAWAAGKYLIRSINQISPKVLKKLKGAVGPAGPQGAQGLPGVNGTNGKDGAPGKDGEDGKDGKSVEAVEFGPAEEPVSEPCTGRGGIELISAEGVNYICTGEEGSPWTAGGVLPSKKTETGMFAASGKENTKAALSFPIPLAVGTVIPGSKAIVNASAGEGDISTTTEPTKITNVVLSKGRFEVGGPISGEGISLGTKITAKSGSFTPTSKGTLTLSQPVTETKVGAQIAQSVLPECDNGEGPEPEVSNPEADPGYLCLFYSSGLAPSISPIAFGPGAQMSWSPTFAEVSPNRQGSFAVTAP